MINQLTQEQIKWLKSMNITNYEYDSNRGLVNVDGDVDISYKNLTSIPIQFGYVGGYFDCGNNNLTTLQGGPREVGGDFYCGYNNLTTLQGSPREVGGDFDCINNNFKTEPDHSFIDIGKRFVYSVNNFILGENYEDN